MNLGVHSNWNRQGKCPWVLAYVWESILPYICLYSSDQSKGWQNYLQSAKRMAEWCNKQRKVQTYSVGSRVSVRIPLIDRARSDLHHLPLCWCWSAGSGSESLPFAVHWYSLHHVHWKCKQLLLLGHYDINTIMTKLWVAFNFFHRCNHSVLKVCCSASKVEDFRDSLNYSVEGWKDIPSVTLREAAQQLAPWNSWHPGTAMLQMPADALLVPLNQARYQLQLSLSWG